jgi:Caspase domain
MANQACISIGINQYQYLPPLGYGMADAVAMDHFFVDAAGWNPAQCLLLTDTSPNIGDKSTYPDRENINQWLQQWTWDTLRHGDLLWFFFSGCGVSFEGEDYLMPIDGTLADIEHTCISIRQLYRQFSEIGVNALVFLDANHQRLTLDGGIGQVTAKLAQEYQIPTFLSCQTHESSHEDAGLGHGLFTTALLEALNYHHDLNLETIETYLASRIEELGEHHWKPLQTPLMVIPTGVSSYRPVFSATTQSTISATSPEPIYTPPIAPGFARDEYAPYTPPTTSFIPSSPTGTGAIVKRSRLTPTPKYVPHWAKIGVLLTLIVAAGGLIYLLTRLPINREQPTIQPITNLTTPTVTTTGTAETFSIAQATAKVKSGDATSRYVAILMARKIPATTPAAAAEVQQSIEQWSQEIFLIAHGYARKQRWQTAIDTARMVPPDATNYADVQASMARWQSRL